MIYIVNMVMASPNCETPAPVPESQSLQAGSKSDSVNGKEFAKKLKDLEDNDLSETQDKDTGEIGDDKKDNGRQSNSDILNAIYGIAGILEGFGSLSYQKDSTEIKGTNIDPQSAALQANQEALVNAAGAGQDQENGLSEQIAWMLQKQGTGGTPAQTQDEMLKTIGEYLDSLENTSKDAAGQLNVVQADGAVINPEIILNTQNNAQNNINNADTAQKGSGEDFKALLEKTEPETKDTKDNSSDALSTLPAKDAESIMASSSAKNDEANKGTSAATLNSLKGGNNEEKEVKADSSNKDNLTGSKNSSKLNKTDVNAKTASASPEGVQNFKSEVNNAVQTDSKTALTGTQYTAGTMGENVVRIVNSIKTGAADGKYQFDIQLKPEFLGKVNITLSMKDDNLKVRIKTDDPTVKGLLSDQTASLQSLFKEKGITVTSIEITYDNPSMQYNDGQTFSQQNSSGNTGGNLNYQPAAEEESYETAAEQYNSYAGDGNIELYA